MYAPSDQKRNQFFQGLLAELGKASTDGYSMLKVQCNKIQSAIEKTYSLLPPIADTNLVLQGLKEDSYSKTIIPPDAPARLIPLQCIGDGNCLFR